jgi:hypothetical protein
MYALHHGPFPLDSTKLHSPTLTSNARPINWAASSFHLIHLKMALYAEVFEQFQHIAQLHLKI